MLQMLTFYDANITIQNLFQNNFYNYLYSNLITPLFFGGAKKKNI